MAKIPSTKTSSTKKTTYPHIEPNRYPARMVRFIGLGVQDQPVWKDQVKEPAFKVSIAYELYDPETLKPLSVIGVDSEGNETEPRPSCVFQDYFLFPGAKRGKVFDLCQAIEPSLQKSPDDIEWFIERLGTPLTVTVDTYPRKDGTFGNKVTDVSGMAAFMAKQLEQARTKLVGFDPYESEDKMEDAYAELYPYQRTILEDAHDAKHIPLAGKEPKKFEKEAGAPHAAKDEQADDDDRPF